MTEVNSNDEQQEHEHERHEHDRGGVPVGPSIPVLLVCVADMIMTGGVPVPAQVEVSARVGVWVTLARHVELRAWAHVLGMTVWPSHSQPYVDGGGVLCQLTVVAGRWRDAALTLYCVEPVDAVAVPRGDDGQVCR